MSDQQIAYLSSNQRRTRMVGFLCCFAVKIKQHKSVGLPFYGLTSSKQLLSRRQTIDKVGQFRLPMKSGEKNVSSVMQRSAKLLSTESTKVIMAAGNVLKGCIQTVACMRDISKILASNRGFLGSGYFMMSVKFYRDRPWLPRQRNFS